MRLRRNLNFISIIGTTLIVVFLIYICTLTMFNKTEAQSEVSTYVTMNDDNIEITDIVSYYQNPTLELSEEINSLGEEYVSFVVVTDTHGTQNANNSQNIIRYLLKKTRADKLFHLGDSVDVTWDEAHYKLYFDSFKNCMPQVFYTLGNHEASYEVPEEISVIYNDVLADKNYLYGNPSRFYYYFDDVDRQIRYLVINTSDLAYNDVTNEQLDWIKESVQVPTSDWKIIAFGHMDIMPNDLIMKDWYSIKAQEITDALSSTNGTIVGYFCGHEHCDLIQMVNNKFYEVILLNDNCSKDVTFEGITNPERVYGTESEQVVSVIIINTLTGDVQIRRIGAGESFAYNYLDIFSE